MNFRKLALLIDVASQHIDACTSTHHIDVSFLMDVAAQHIDCFVRFKPRHCLSTCVIYCQKLSVKNLSAKNIFDRRSFRTEKFFS